MTLTCKKVTCITDLCTCDDGLKQCEHYPLASVLGLLRGEPFEDTADRGLACPCEKDEDDQVSWWEGADESWLEENEGLEDARLPKPLGDTAEEEERPVRYA